MTLHKILANALTKLNTPFYVTRPLSKTTLKQIRNTEDRICLHLRVSLYDLIGSGEDAGLEGFNELVEGRVTRHGYLSEINYKIVGHQTAKNAPGYVIIEVAATINGID